MSATATAPPDPLHRPWAARRRAIAAPTSIGRRILAVNLLAIVFLFAGIIYLDEYRNGLISAEFATLNSEARLFAAALAESATVSNAAAQDELVAPLAQQIIRRLVEASGLRAQLFSANGALVADSLQLRGPGGRVQIEELPPPATGSSRLRDAIAGYDRLLSRLWQDSELPPATEPSAPSAPDYEEVVRALAGHPSRMLRARESGGMALSVAVPVQRYTQIVGALMLTKGSAAIDAAVLNVRIELFKWFMLVLAVTVLMSLYLANTIARPLRRLANAAEKVRRDRHRRHPIPDLRHRRDEIGQLSAALREMTDALWQRMDAIERFAADVAHELKNPLTSLRSAVETAARIHDPERRNRLMAIIEQDVGRLDRLISDISEASRVDAELSRGGAEPVDIGRMLETLIEVTETTATERQVRLHLRMDDAQPLIVRGIEGRLVQVFRNLIGNALSFSPPGSAITLAARRDGDDVTVTVDDEGPGVPPGRETEIFKRFYSERPAGETFGRHSGLGLSISQQIIEAHRGAIHAENRIDAGGAVAGARFVVRLPLA